MVVFQVNLSAETVYPQITFSTYSGEEPLEMHGTGFTGLMTFLLPNQQCRGTEGVEALTLIREITHWTHPFFIHHWILWGKEHCCMNAGSPYELR